jgi:hypothetical protein
VKLALVRTKMPPIHFSIGVALVAVFWFASWTHLGFMGSYAFFPQWLGYILVADACVAWRRGDSLLTHDPGEFVALFILSAPVWWLFEGLNNFVLNWHYIDTVDFSFWRMLLVGTLDFSTVIPAVFETAALISTFQFVERLRTHRRFAISSRLAWGLMYAGAFSLAAVVLVPQYAFPLAWVWLVLIVDPLNYLRGRASLLGQISRGDWRSVLTLALATVICGFFWEMWNYFAMPKWFYTVPFVGFLKVFEMPLLGYGGYWPFAWELYALYHLVWGVVKRRPAAFALENVQPGSAIRMGRTR